MPTYEGLGLGLGTAEVTRDRSRAVFGQVMGLVALTLGCTALGAYIGRNLSGGTGLLLFFAAFACIFGLQFATRAGAPLWCRHAWRTWLGSTAGAAPCSCDA